MSTGRLEWAVATLALVAVGLAAGLEGATEQRFGALSLVVATAAGGLALFAPERPALSRAARVAVLVLAGVLLLQALPVPAALRELVAPGQAARMHSMAGTVAVAKADWLVALTHFDVAVLFGEPGDYSFNVLAGAHDSGLRMLAVSPSGYVWQVGQWAAYALLVGAGWRLARHQPALLVFLLGIVALGIVEALFGFANRNGPSTGIGTKVSYLGSATGTFVNRGHFAAYLNLAIGALWGLAASLFPLLPEEVRRHQARKRRSSQPPGLLEVSGDKVPRLILLTFIAATLFVGLVASNSRGPLVSLVVAGIGVGAWAWWRREEKVHLGFGVAAPLAGVALATLALGPRGALGRFLTLGSNDVSLTSRLDLWRASIAAFLDAPIFGAGAGGWPAAFGPHERGAHLFDVLHAHSEAVELLVELGAVGFLAVLALGIAFLRGVARRADVVEHDFDTGVGFGALVAVVAVVLQSGLDFPLRTPGVAVPFFLFVGIVLSTFNIPRPDGARWPVAGLVAVALFLLIPAGLADHHRGGSREARRSEAAPAFLLAQPQTAEAAAEARVEVCATAAAEPFDAWQQVACAITASRVAAVNGSVDAAFEAEVAALRALALHPRDPRIQVQVAQVWVRLRKPTLLPEAFGERATRLLMEAVRLDGWRAEDAFRLARVLAPEAIDRVGGSASSVPVSRARTLYQYGVVLEERGRDDDAQRAVEEAAASDPPFGPPAFRAGLLARKRGDKDAAQRWFRAFLAARDRPTAMEGWSLLYLDEASAAEVRFRRALATNPRNRWAWEGLAGVAVALGERTAECEAWRKVLLITPAHPQAKTRIGELGC